MYEYPRNPSGAAETPFFDSNRWRPLANRGCNGDLEIKQHLVITALSCFARIMPSWAAPRSTILSTIPVSYRTLNK